MADDGSFMVDLAALGDAINKVSTQRDAILNGIQQIKSTFVNVEDHWKSPSGTSFVTLATNFNGVADELMALFNDAIQRMRVAYQNYSDTENTNTNNYH